MDLNMDLLFQHCRGYTGIFSDVLPTIGARLTETEYQLRLKLLRLSLNKLPRSD